ncbi:MAG: hypothetical protein Q4B34_00170, partial [Candidatus Saccharibacteria bacterium]|nr:hypothetical protein [Candidatus Saccharibacteria bacterium]
MKKIIAVLGVGFGILGTLIGGEVFAATEQDCLNSSVDSSIQSIKDACSFCFNDSERVSRGTLWINGNPSSSAGDIVDVPEGASTVDFYVRGRVYSCGQSVSGTRYAYHVKLFNENNEKPNWITFTQDQTLSRGTGSGSSYAWTTAGADVKLSGKIDVAKFKKGLTGTTSGEYTIYKRDVYVYRCPTSTISSSACYSSKSEVQLKIKNEYYSSSSVMVDDVTEGTGIQKTDGTAETAGPINIEVLVGATKTLKFEHKTYASVAGTKVSSKVTKTSSLGTGEVTDASNSGSTATDDKYYLAHTYSKSYDIKFDTPGDYEYCERVYIDGKSSTRACVNVTAVAYYSESSATNGKGGSGTTGIEMTTGTAQEKVLEEVTVAVGDTVYPTFSHKTYSSHAGKNVKAKIEKSEWKSGEADEAWTVEKESGDLSEQTATSQNHKTDGYYLAADRETSKYKVTFNGAGYYTLCETITVNDRASTKVCVKYKAVYNYKNEVSISVNGPVFAGENITVNGASTNIIQNNTNY